MSEPIRVPLPSRHFIGNDDIAPHISRVNYARRFSLDIAEDALAQMGQSAIPVVVEQLAKHITYSHTDDIARSVLACITDRAWIQPIIEEEVRRAVKAQSEKMINMLDIIRAERQLAQEEEDARDYD